MKIIFYRHSLLSRGGDKMILAHAGYLASKGWSVEIRTSQTATVFTIPDGVEIFNLGFRYKWQTVLYALKTRFDADFIVADIIPLVCFLAFRNRVNVVYFAQDYDETYYRSYLQRLLVRILYFAGLTLFRVRTIAVAEHLSKLLRERFKARVETVANGVDTDVFYPDPNPELLAAKQSRRAILVLSRADSRKGFDLCCRIYKDLANELGDDDLEIWTVGEPASGLFERGLHRDFGYVSPARLRRILSSADVFLYHTRHEGFPLMALEALACGCPMAASNAIRMVHHEREALIASVGDLELAADHVVRILSMPPLADKLRRNGLEFAKVHSMSQSSSDFLEVLCGFA